MKKTTRILTVVVLAVSSVLFATPSQAVPTVNIAIDCVANVGAKYDQPVAGGWVVVATFTNCTTITPNWPQGTTWELKNGAYRTDQYINKISSNADVSVRNAITLCIEKTIDFISRKDSNFIRRRTKTCL